MALARVEAIEEAERREDPEGWRERADSEVADLTREPPGILARIQEDEPDEVPGDHADSE
jgi:hypothetical protein